MHSFRVLTIASIIACSLTTPAIADRKVKAKISNAALVAVASGGTSDSSGYQRGSKSVTVSSAEKSTRLYVVGSDGALAGPVISYTYAGKPITFKDLRKNKYCSKSAAKVKAYTGLNLKNGEISLGKLSLQSGFLTAANSVANVNKATSASVASDCSPNIADADTLGLSSANISTKVNVRATTDDSDGDGLGDIFDADDDNDRVLDPFDRSAVINAREIRIFSNLKVGLQQSLNVNAGTAVSSSLIDQLVRDNATLAIQVAGDPTDTVELDCGALSYCSSGGSGTQLNSTTAFPDASDSDSDGLGTITRGATGDFQLMPHATALQIGAGDAFIERVTSSSGVETEYTGMLNFIFNTVPAIESVALGASTYMPTYPVINGAQGTENNCFLAPADWDKRLSIVAWRAQRPGIPASGEATYMDIGNSTFVVDIPNAPCSTATSGGCPGSLTSRCTASAYTTSSTSLTVSGDGLLDLSADAAADPTSKIDFTVDLAACLGTTAWNSGEKLFIDLQQKSSVGDNAAQKFCVQLP